MKNFVLIYCCVFWGAIAAFGQADRNTSVTTLLRMYLGNLPEAQLSNSAAAKTAELLALAQQQPQRTTDAVLIFDQAVPEQTLLSLAGRYNMQLLSARYEAPTGNGPVLTGEFRGFAVFKGTLAEQFTAFRADLLKSEQRRSETLSKQIAAAGGASDSLKHALQRSNARAALIRAGNLVYVAVHVRGTTSSLAQLWTSGMVRLRLMMSYASATAERDGIQADSRLPLGTLSHASGGAGTSLLRAGNQSPLVNQGIEIPWYLQCPDPNRCPPDPTWLPGLAGGSFWSVEVAINATTFYPNGYVDTIVTFGTEQVPNPYDGGTPFTINTSAYNGPASLPRCKLQFDLTNTETDCVPDTLPNSVLVGKSAFEIELQIPDPACGFVRGIFPFITPAVPPLLRRTGTTLDFLYGCYGAVSWSSDLPGAYLDTTFSDAASRYQAAVGAYDGNLIAAAVAYNSSIDFLKFIPDLNVAGRVVELWGQIGSSEFVVPGLCPAAGLTWCVFAVDINKMGEGVLEPI